MAMVKAMPVDLRLCLVGDQDDTGHTFFVSVEGLSGGTALVNGREVAQPWLRAVCSCGWRSPDYQRTTLEENAHHQWLYHVRDARDA